MKDRRGFLKLLGIGAGAAVGAALAAVAARTGGTPVTPPRTIQDIEAPKPYIGPDSVPGGDFIKERPKMIPFVEQIREPEPVPNQPGLYHYDLSEIDWDTVEWTTHVEPGEIIPTVQDAMGWINTSGTYDPTTGMMSTTNGTS